MSVSSISLDHRRTTSGPGSYQIDYTANGTLTAGSSASVSTTCATSVSISPNVIVTSGNTIVVKILYWNTSTVTGNLDFRNVTVSGVVSTNNGPTITQINPSTSFTLANCSSTASGSVDFTATGTYNTGNTFTVELSDASGSFVSATSIGSLSSTSTSGNIPITIPAGLATGTGYKIRIKSSNPASISTASSISITQNGYCISSSSDYFQSKQDGIWSQNSTWLTSQTGSAPWIDATLSPTSAAAAILIQNAVTVNAAASGKAITVSSSGDLILTSALTVSSGSTLNVNGQVTNSTGGSLTTTGATVSFNSGSTYNHAQNGGSIPTATWNSNSLCNVTGVTTTAVSTSSLGQSFGNFTWNCTGQAVFENLNNASFSTQGLLKIDATGATYSLTLIFNDATDRTYNFNSIEVNGGRFVFGYRGSTTACGIATVNATGNVIINGGEIDFGQASSPPTGTGYYRSILNIGGNLTIAPSAKFWCTNSSYWGKVNFNKSGTQTVSINSSNVARVDYYVANLSETQMLSNINVGYVSSSDYDEVIINGILDASTYQITGGGNITINGTLKTSNANGLENTGTFAATGIKTLATGSTINYNGTSNQIFSALTDYKNVIIDGGSNKTLNGNATIANTLNFISGKIVLGANSLTQNGSITGASATSYVVTDGTGELMRTLATNTSFDFPIGSLANYEPANITFVTAPASGTISGRFITGAPGNVGLPITETDEITQASSGGYWEINSAGTTESYTGTFTANNFGDIIDYTKTHLLKRSSTVGSSWLFDGTHVATNGSNTSAVLQRTGMSGFSQFAVGGKPASSLPVTLLGLSGYRDVSRNQLRWGTGCESRNKGFEVQRSNDGINYTAIGFVNSLAPNGSSNSTLYYQFTDNTPQGEKQFYRLRQVDMDGNTKLSNVIMINGDRATSMAITNLYPNPAKDVVNLVIGSPSVDNGMIIISDFAGKVVLKQNVTLGTGTNAVSFNISNLANGQYMVKLVCDANCTSYTKFVKQ